MTDDEKWLFVAERLDLLRKQMDALDDAVDGLLIAPESPLIEPFYRVAGELIHSLEVLVGDGFHTLNYWVYECDWGGKPMEVVSSSGEKREMRSLEDIRWAVECD